MRIYLIGLICMLIASLLAAQSQKNISEEILAKKNIQLDSLRQKLLTDTGNEELLKEIIELCKATDQDSLAFVYLSKLIEISEGKENELIKLKIEKAEIVYRLNKDSQAIQLLNDILAQKGRLDEEYMTLIRTRLARYLSNNNQYEQALKYSLENEKVFLENEDSLGITNTYSMIGRISFKMGNLEECAKSYEKAGNYCPSSRSYMKATLLLNSGLLFSRLSDNRRAIEMAERAEKIAVQNDLFEIFGGLYKTFGIIHYGNENYDKSLSYCLKSLNTTTETRQKKTFFLSLYKYIALNYYEKKDYTNAIFYFKKLDNLDTEHAQIRETAKDVAENEFVDTYARTGNFREAFYLLKRYSIIQDSFIKEEQNLKLAEITEKFENEKNQLVIKGLKQDNNLQKLQLSRYRGVLILGTAFFFTLVGIVLLLYRMKMNKQKLKDVSLNLRNTKLKHQFLRAQLNPHFLFHAMSSIESYVLKGEKEKSAGFLQSFSLLMRNILETSDVDFITLAEDLSFIEKYLDLQQLNHGFVFRYSIDIDEDIETESLMIPPMLTQPFIENAILHGALPSRGQIKISILKDGINLIIQIENSIPNTPAASVSSKKLNRSMSTEIVKQRIKNLQDTHNIKITHSISTNALNEGHYKETVVTLKFPLLRRSFISK